MLGIAVFSITVLENPMTIMAAEKTQVEENEVKPYTVNTFNRTVTDSKGNKYSIIGISERAGKQAGVSTSFFIKTYGDGHLTANGYKKTMTASGKVGMNTGANNTLSQRTYSKSGDASGKISSSDSYLYNVSVVTGSHTFSCNGASGSGSSNNY